MGIFNDRSKRALVGAMRECVCDTLMESATLTSKQATDKMNFIFENATYEQLLNITMNPDRDSNYLPSYVLEGAVAILHRACLTGREYIGKNAITEAAKLIHNETGAVITESMKKAALNSVNNGNGLKVVGKLLEEAKILQEEMTIDGINRLINSVRASNPTMGAEFETIAQAFANRNGGGFNALQVNSALDRLGIAAANRQGIINALQAGDTSMLGSLGRIAREGGVTSRITNLQAQHAAIASRYGAGSAEAIRRSNALNDLVNRTRNLGKNLPAPAGIPGKAPNVNPALFNDYSRTIANQGKKMNPWVAAGLGAAGVLGGAYLYKRYKENQANQ